MAFDVKTPLEAGKKALINYALPLVIGTFVVALVAAIIGAKME